MNTLERPDTFRKVHKALRKTLFDTTYLAGRTDFTIDHELEALKTQVNELVHFLHMHAHKEETYSFPLIEAKCPGASAHDQAEHEKIDQLIADLEHRLATTQASPLAVRPGLGYDFYLALNRFVSVYLMHMDEEETDTTAQTYALCTDEEIQGVTQKIIASMSPADAGLSYRYMIPALHSGERTAFFKEVQATAPPFVLQNLLSVASTTLSAHEFQQLETAVVRRVETRNF
ncbi:MULTISPECIES: hemerythrin domain-containing protein [unclassified Spirosoma]|uniref:hemerythrin domain-containing protein n=1 Tax=unclassified Spirosoma TaxID=2621999 RepID=UPI000962479D|nr:MULTISPECIES: hemerythrin domain-containing protein [unclassified Spirosoma]MBN8823235.1 hemerythrin domain-containing protein [Spirosoma sp.]OJW72616.1 MAG: hypothetical protein BGO59_15985 [Spirosoma sp. 48-14]